MRFDVGVFLRPQERKRPPRISQGSGLLMTVTLSNIRTTCQEIAFFAWDNTRKAIVGRPAIFHVDKGTQRIQQRYILFHDYYIAVGCYEGENACLRPVKFGVVDGDQVKWCSDVSLSEFSGECPEQVSFDVNCDWNVCSVAEALGSGIVGYDYLYEVIENEMAIMVCDQLPKAQKGCVVSAYKCQMCESIEVVRSRTPDCCCEITRPGLLVCPCVLHNLNTSEVILVVVSGAKGELWYGVFNFHNAENSSTTIVETKATSKKGLTVLDIERCEGNVACSLSVFVRKPHGLNSISISSLNQNLKMSEIISLIKDGYAHEVGKFLERDWCLNDIVCLELEKIEDVRGGCIGESCTTQVELVVWGKQFREFRTAEMDSLATLARVSEAQARVIGSFIGKHILKVSIPVFEYLRSQLPIATQRLIIVQMFHAKCDNLPVYVETSFREAPIYYAGVLELICSDEKYKGNACMPLLKALLDLPKSLVQNASDQILAPIFAVFEKREQIDFDLTQQQIDTALEWIADIVSKGSTHEDALCEAVAALFEATNTKTCPIFFNITSQLREISLSQKLLTRFVEKHPKIFNTFTNEYASAFGYAVMRHILDGDSSLAARIMFRWLRSEWTHCFTCNSTVSSLQEAFTDIAPNTNSLDAAIANILAAFKEEQPEFRNVCNTFVNSLLLCDLVRYDIEDPDIDLASAKASLDRLQPYPTLYTRMSDILLESRNNE